jgi:phosphoserine phosphatase
MHDLSAYPLISRVAVECNGRTFVGCVNTKNVNLLTKFYKLGYDVIVWSKTGSSWARAVVEALQLTEYVSHCLSKPDFIMDDQDVSRWIGPRCYRDPKTGNEHKEEG